MTVEHAEAAVRFTEALLSTHHAMPRSPDDPVQRCGCGRAMVMCEINSAARDAGLLTAVSGPTPVIRRESTEIAVPGMMGRSSREGPLSE